MKIFHALALVAALAVPAAAQQMGSANRNAPKVVNSIEFAGGAKAELSYTSLNFAEGMFMKRIKESEQFRNFVNQNAKENPLGSFTLPAAMMMGGKQVEAGTYGLHFLASDSGGWVLTLSHKKDGELALIQWELPLQEVKTTRKRLALMLVPGDADGSAALHLHFGNMAVDVDILPVKKD